MTVKPTRSDPAGRIYLDLRHQARADGRATDEYLRLYALEAFLARLSASQHRDKLVLKGGASQLWRAAFDGYHPVSC
jgi:predicted nucleotidyltransferase component of viral defense system